MGCRIDLNLLVVLHQLLRSNVSRVAASLGRQPAVSNALRRLRECLGDELFLRKPPAWSPRPTPAARQPWPRPWARCARRSTCAPPSTRRMASAASPWRSVTWADLLPAGAHGRWPPKRRIALRCAGGARGAARGNGQRPSTWRWARCRSCGRASSSRRCSASLRGDARRPPGRLPAGPGRGQYRQARAREGRRHRGQVDTALERLGVARQVLACRYGPGPCCETDLIATVPERFAQRALGPSIWSCAAHAALPNTIHQLWRPTAPRPRPPVAARPGGAAGRRPAGLRPHRPLRPSIGATRYPMLTSRCSR